VVILKESPRDWVLVVVVALLSLGSNLPVSWTDFLQVDRRFFLGGLIAVVGVALVRYLKVTLLLVIVILAVGANLPEDVAKEFNIDPQFMLLALVGMVVVSLSNKVFKLPTGLEKTSRSKSVHGAAALFNSILKGRIAVVQSLLSQGVNVNVRTVTGKTPLMAASYKGYSDIVQLLLDNGADPNIADHSGDTALKMAERAGFTRLADQIRKATAHKQGESVTSTVGAAPAS
jgi:hypothetical protein